LFVSGDGQAKLLVSSLQNEKQAADVLLQANAARLSGLETRWQVFIP
jgi:hypothetical protein